MKSEPPLPVFDTSCCNVSVLLSSPSPSPLIPIPIGTGADTKVFQESFILLRVLQFGLSSLPSFLGCKRSPRRQNLVCLCVSACVTLCSEWLQMSF